MNTVVLGEFVEPVPVCAQTASLKTVLEQFRHSNCEQLVVVNEQQQPLGVLRLHRFMSSWLTPTAEGLTLACTNQTLSDFLTPTAEPLIEPLLVLPLQLRLPQLQPHLQALPYQQYALVDQMGRYQGLLDRLRLLRFWVLHTTAEILPTEPQVPILSTVCATLPVDRSPLIDTPIASPASLHPVAFAELMELLEQLPLPLMLQTSTGEVVVQNWVWRQQVGELQNPEAIHQAAAVLMESGDAQEPVRYLKNDWEQQPSLESACQSGSDPNSCICVCPMKNGQEQVWTFIKIPLGTDPIDFSKLPGFAHLEHRPVAPLSSEHELSHGFHAQATASQFASPAFQLATLALEENPSSKQAASAVVPTQGLWLVLAQDTTEQQQVARELAAKNADLIQLNRLKDEFLACISHELKTPLTAILGLSSLLKNQSMGALNDRQLHYAQLIHKSGRHLILIVNNILDLTRIETGQLTLIPEAVAIEAICISAYEQARQVYAMGTPEPVSAATATEPRFSLKIEPGLDNIVADELRLRQMLTNLLSNALKFTTADSSIGLNVESWEGWIAFTIWDRGIGIPTDKQHLIFQKFQQLENPLTRRFDGTGLGLVLTQRLARLHGGDVTFTSIEAQGSEFTLLLPPAPPATSDAGAGIPVKRSIGSNRLVLVIEAVPQFLEGLSHDLCQLGYRVAIARSGTEAIEKTRRLQPAIVFLNPVLPLLSGWDVLTLLKSDSETRHIPIVVTATQAEKQQAYGNGADGFVSLPVQLDALQHILERQLQQAEPPAALDLLSNLTVLHLWVSRSPSGAPFASSDPTAAGVDRPIDLNTLLYPHHCRILEVDDLEQADLLARVWKPDVMLLDGVLTDQTGASSLSEAIDYLRQLGQQAFLATLPIVTLTPELTQAANRIPGLAVFPCLAAVNASSDLDGTSSTLVQVLQVAAGMSWTPHILLVDLSALAESEGFVEGQPKKAIGLSDGIPLPDWQQATAQYLQTAGFRATVSASWADLVHHLRHQSVDLLLLWVRAVEPHTSLIRALRLLAQLQPQPPILVREDMLSPDKTCEASSHLAMHQAASDLAAGIATQVLPASASMKELLEQIQRILQQR